MKENEVKSYADVKEYLINWKITKTQGYYDLYPECIPTIYKINEL